MFRCLFILSFFINVHLFSFSQIHSYQLTDKDHKENCVIGIFDNVQRALPIAVGLWVEVHTKDVQASGVPL